MKKSVLLLTVLLTNMCWAGQLTSYQATVDALNSGKRIKFVVDWDLCKISIPDAKPNFSSSYSPEIVTIDKSGFLQSTGMRYSHEIKLIPQLGPVNQAYVYTFSKNNELHVINRFLDPVTYAEKILPVEATCELGKGFKVFA